VFKDIFAILNVNGEKYNVSLSFFEIYLEQVNDLLKKENKNLKIRVYFYFALNFKSSY
jgi:hypothetical protein